MSADDSVSQIAPIVRKWKKQRGSLIMALHDIQDRQGHVPRELALELARAMDVPLARIYEVLTFYNYFKTEPPGKVVVSVCTGTACYLRGAPELLAALTEELGIEEGESSGDGGFHLQAVRCVGCCGLSPAIMVNGKIYGKVKPAEIRGIISQWREWLARQEGGESDG